MRFRPCIDIHDGKVKQIVGGSLTEKGAEENFVSEKGAEYFAEIYRKDELCGGHVILLNGKDQLGYRATKQAALAALRAFPGGLMAGGGIDPDNAEEFLAAGASHVIVTSYVFRDGVLDRERLKKMEAAVGKARLVLDLSCRKKDGRFWVVTDRWQKFTSEEVNKSLLCELAEHADEFLIHGVDVEGKQAGIEEDLVSLLGEAAPIPVTYAGGVGKIENIIKIKELGKGRVDITIGSALDLFGGALPYREIISLFDK